MSDMDAVPRREIRQVGPNHQRYFELEMANYTPELLSKSLDPRAYLASEAKAAYDWILDNILEYECLQIGAFQADSYLLIRFSEADAVAFKLRWF
jgi:hypothetical protein